MTQNDVKLMIYENYIDNMITESEKDTLLELVENNIFLEAFITEASEYNRISKEMKALKDKKWKLEQDIEHKKPGLNVFQAKKEIEKLTREIKIKENELSKHEPGKLTKFKNDVVDKTAGKVNTGMNKVVNKVVKPPKDPTKGGTVKVSDEVYKKYMAKLKSYRIKRAGTKILLFILTTQFHLIPPIGMLVTAIEGTGILNSKDDVDKDIQKIYNSAKYKLAQLKEKFNKLKERAKNKSISEQEASNQLQSIETAGAAIAKQIDSAKSKKAKLANNVSEAVYDICNMKLLTNGKMTTESYDILSSIIEATDYSTNPEVFDIVWHYCLL